MLLWGFQCVRPVVFGIIIDTFGELRGQAKDKQEKMASCCFICNLDNSVLDKEAGGFDLHVKHDHNVRDCSGSTCAVTLCSGMS